MRVLFLLVCFYYLQYREVAKPSHQLRNQIYIPCGQLSLVKNKLS